MEGFLLELNSFLHVAPMSVLRQIFNHNCREKKNVDLNVLSYSSTTRQNYLKVYILEFYT